MTLSPIVLEKSHQSTTVMGLDMIEAQLPRDLQQAIAKGKYKRELQECMEEQNGAPLQIDVFKQQYTETTLQMLARVPTEQVDNIIMSSGQRGLYWTPMGEARKRHAVIWLKGDASTDFEAAA